MRLCAIEEGYVEPQSTFTHPLANNLGDISRAGSNFQQRERRRGNLARHAPDHPLGGGDASEPAVTPPQIGERGYDLGRGAGVVIEQFGNDYTFHGKALTTEDTADH